MDNKGADTSGCNAGPARVGRRRHGRCRSAYMRSDLHGDGFRVVEGTPALGKTLPFAGRRWNAGLGRSVRTRGLSSPPDEGSTTNQEGVLGWLSEEGNLRPRRTAAAGGGREDPSLGVTRLVQSSAVVQRSSPQAVVGLRRRPQAASRLVGSFQRRILGALAAPWGRRRKDCRGSRLS